MGYRQVPVLGVNLGRLGFLADIHPQEFHVCFAKVLAGAYRVTRHLMYECVVGDGPVARRRFWDSTRSWCTRHRPCTCSIWRWRPMACRCRAFSGDGLIISTPVGSTGHNLSAGGPILGQELAAFVLTPLCPHALTYRPVVDSADRIYTIHLGRGMDNALVIVDGQESVELRPGERVLIRKAPVTFGLVKMQDRTFFQTLRRKLRWGTTPNYRSEPG